MVQAYTPGLIVAPSLKLSKVRELPIKGRTLVKIGEKVKYDQPVMTAEIPGEIEIVRLIDRTGLDLKMLNKGIRPKIGDKVEKGALLFELKTFFSLFSTKIESPVNGTVEFFNETNGHLGIRTEPLPLNILAYLNGTVKDLEEGKSVTIEAESALIQGIFGVGGEKFGKLLALDVSNDTIVTAEILSNLKTSLENKVLVGGATFSLDALEEARAQKVSAILTGSIDAETLHSFLGFDIGLAITGDEDLPFTLIISEGFGKLPISPRILNLATKLTGKICSVNGATQVRAGAMRPEIIVSDLEDLLIPTAENKPLTLQIGSPVRIIRVPYFGLFGEICELPYEPQKMESGTIVRVAKVRLTSGKEVIVPRANIELV